ncbi:MAG: hypothetical protein ABL958_21850 [Bdellovibrionia bacterium]
MTGLLGIGLAACGTAQTVSTPPASRTESVRSAPAMPSISELKTRLKMNRESSELGFQEGRFGGDSYLVTIHFQLLCRMSEDTVDEAPELFAVKEDSVSWKLGALTGSTHTDRNGYGRVETIRDGTSRHERLRLTVEKRFVAVPASEAATVVVPRAWCGR